MNEREEESMRTREMTLRDHGMWPEDEEKIYKYCRKLSQEEALELFQCCISSAYGIEVAVYDSMTTGAGYKTQINRGRYIPVKADDFYAYRRKTAEQFYRFLRMHGKMC